MKESGNPPLPLLPVLNGLVLVCLAGIACGQVSEAPGGRLVPDDVVWEAPLYSTSFEDPAVLAEWKPRDGLFEQYIRGDINNYHISYWAGDRGIANLRKNAGHNLVCPGKDLVYTAPDGAWQTIRVHKRDGKIRLIVDDILSLAWKDDGVTLGPVHNHSGWIGLRQMARTDFAEYGQLTVYRLH